MKTLSWYRRIAAIYDPICRPLYAGPRRAAVAALQLQPGQTVIDLCTGTGLNLPLLSRAVRPDGNVIGVDLCPQMLSRARTRTAKFGLGNVQLHQADAGAISAADLGDWVSRESVDAVICTFGLAVAPNWEQIRSTAWALLCPAGRMAIADNQPFPRYPLRAINFPWVQAANFSGAAEIRRPTWELPTSGQMKEPRQEFLAGFVFVASCVKPGVEPNDCDVGEQIIAGTSPAAPQRLCASELAD